MYTVTNFKTKKSLQQAIAKGKQIRCYSPGLFSCPANGIIRLEGPHPHRWYTLKNGIVIAVK